MGTRDFSRRGPDDPRPGTVTPGREWRSGPDGSRVTWVGTSWKMNKTIAQTEQYCRRLVDAVLPPGVQPFICPPFTALAAARATIPCDAGVIIGAQNAHWAAEGAWTGEVSMAMVRDAGADLVEIGHSERREHFGETDETVGRKVEAALRHGLVPLVCVGEPRGVREAGHATEFVLAQVDAAVARIAAPQVRDVIVAYEPVWAIGAQGVPARPDDVAPVMHEIAARLRDRSSGVGCRALLYGGGVDSANAAEMLGLTQVDGLFVGRAAWDAEGLLTLVEIAARCRPIPASAAGVATLHIER